ncbi:MAG: hypothetical protein U0Z26_00815 [Anaerolineales bacterium]
MLFRKKTSLYMVMIATVLTVSAIMTVPAYADGETPPAEPSVVTQPTEPPVQDTGTVDAAATPQPTLEPAPVSTELPEGTDMVVLDAQGESLPLASQEAAQTIVTGDPIWCPAGVAVPVAGMSGCTAAYDNFSALVTELTTVGGLVTNPAMDGTIWIASNYDLTKDGSAIVLDGSTLALNSMSNFKLTLKGGWCDGSAPSCVGLIDTSKPSVLDVPLKIINWKNDVTLSDITFTGANGANSLEVSTTKNIILTNVQTNNNTTGGGAYLHNDIASGVGNVTVTNSQFKGNHGNGLNVTSNGTITLKDVTASNNTHGYGAILDNHTIGVAKTVTLTGTNTFDNNGTATGSDGLNIQSFGQITLNNILASNNGSGANGYGAQLKNDFGTAGVTLTGTNIFGDNKSTGLYILTKGAINLANVYSNSNNGLGAQLDNSAGTTQVVNLTGTNEFKYNGSVGLSVSSKGIITINNVTANSNGNVGVALTNTGTAASGVTLTGSNFFKNNFFTGLNITTNGTVLLNNLDAEGNGITGGSGYGVQVANHSVTNFKGVTVTGNNIFIGNRFDGLKIDSSGIILLNNISSTGSFSGSGAQINNSASGVGVPKAITLTGTNIFNTNNAVGLSITSNGVITINNLTANGNGNIGADISNSASTLPQAVTLIGASTLNNNHVYGLHIVSNGTITTNGITANSNVGFGVYLFNSSAPATNTSNVTMNGTNTFNGNTSDNLSISSHGTVLLNNITSTGSSGKGAEIVNTFSTSSPVTLNGNNTFTDNGDIGLKVLSTGLITVNNLIANHNAATAGNHGAYLVNAASPTSAGVTIKGFGTFNNNLNSGVGLQILSKGLVSTINLTANSNTSYGVSIDTTFGTGGVTLTGNNLFDLNANTNLLINAFGVVTLNSITSTGSASGSGADINNKQAGNQTTPKTVTLTGSNIFSNNNQFGLSIQSYGTVITSAITAAGNLFGVNIDNVNPSFPTPVVTAAAVNLNGPNILTGNTNGNLLVISQGLITTNNITANDSSNGYGVKLINTAGTTAGITMNGSNTFNNNHDIGLDVVTNGVILTNNITVTNSGTAAFGAMGGHFSNTGSTTAHPKTVTLNGTNVFSGNSNTGLTIDTYGAILINNLTANNNGINGMNLGKGADLNNSLASSSAPANVTLTGTNFFNHNYDQGLHIRTIGNIILANVTANSSVNLIGAELDNHTAPSNSFGVTLTGSNTFTGNQGKNLKIDSMGTVTLNAVTANGSVNDFGVYINNAYAGPTHGKPVAFTGTNQFNDNQGTGLVITSYGTVTLSNVTASGTLAGSGVSIDNSGANPKANVVFTGSNAFNNNSTGNGLLIVSDGAVTLNNITANGNTFSGLDVNNSGGTAAVTVTGINTFIGNGDNGATILSQGAVNLTRVTGDLNGQSGLVVNTTGTFTLTCGDFNKNSWYGWEAYNTTLATMIGVFSSLNNTLGPVFAPGIPTVTVRNCPLP